MLVEEAVCAGSRKRSGPSRGDVSKREEITSARAICSWPRDAGQRGLTLLGPGSGLVSSAQRPGRPGAGHTLQTVCRPQGPEGSAVRAVSAKTSESVNNLALRMGSNLHVR